jgi:multiple sugar transport system permease protein
MDGAGAWRAFSAVTLPMLTPTIFFNLVLSIIATFQTFTSAFVATNGGPLDSTLFYVLYLYRKAFQEFQMGYASALAWVLFLIVLVLTLLVVRSARSWVYYEGEKR